MKPLTKRGSQIYLTSRIMRVVVLVIGPFTNTFLLIKTLSTPLFSIELATIAYVLGVVIMCGIHVLLIKHRNKTRDGSENTMTNGIVQALALSVTSITYLTNTTVQILNITGMRQMFLVAFGLITLRIQQTLTGGKASALFSGPISFVVFVILFSIWFGTEFNDETFQHPEPRTDGLHEILAFLVCIIIGAAAQVHILWVMFNHQPDVTNGKPLEWFAGIIAFVHVVLACVSGLIQKTHPFTVDVRTMRLNESVEHMMPRLILSITLLLVCTAPIATNGVFHSIFIDGSVIIAAVLVTNAQPYFGSVFLITLSAVKVVVVFCWLHLFTGKWVPKFMYYLQAVRSNE